MKATLLFTMCLGLVLSLVSAAAVNRDLDTIDRVADQLRMLLGNMTEMVKLANDEGPNDLKTHLDTEELIKEVIENLSIGKTDPEDGNQMMPTNSETEDVKVTVPSTLHCRWHGLGGTCCVHTKYRWFHTKVCISVHVIRPKRIWFIFRIQNRVILRKVVSAFHSVHGCTTYHGKKFCVYAYNVRVFSHSARLCLVMYLTEHGRKRFLNMGCIYRRFPEIETDVTSPSFKSLKTKNQEDPENGEISLFKETDEEILKF